MPRLLILFCIALAGCGAAPAAPTATLTPVLVAKVAPVPTATTAPAPTATGPAPAATTAPALPPTTAPVTKPPVPVGPTVAGGVGQGPPPTVVVSGVADAPAVVTLIAELRRRGIEPAPTSPSSVEFLADAPGQAYQVGSGQLYLHLYPNAEGAGAKHGQVRQGLANPMADPPAPPRAFQCGAVIALYVGREEQVTRALTELCGPQFAGRQ